MRLRVLFYAVNGLGLGHLTRLLGIARALRAAEPSCEILFLTTSEAAHLVYREGFAAVKLPSRNAARRGELRAMTFTRLSQSLVWSTLTAFDPHVLVVDTFALGSWHELGPILRWPLRKVFVFRAQKSERALDPGLVEALKLYDLILIPHHASGDEVSPRDLRLPSETRVVWTGPMTLRGRAELLPRDEARARLLRDGLIDSLPPDAPLGLVALGGGGGPGLDEARALLARAIRQAQSSTNQRLKQTRWIEMAGPLDTSSIDSPLAVPGPTQVLEDAREARLPWLVMRDVHPMGAILRAFDGAVAAAGYNTVAESQVAALPTLLWPFARDVDDQAARARLLVNQGRALVFEPPADPATWTQITAQSLASQMQNLLGEETNSRLRASILAWHATQPEHNGTQIGARAILDLFGLPQRAREDSQQRPHGPAAFNAVQ